MPIYTKESLELLRGKIDLLEVISSHVELKKQGGTYKGLCPFHEEKSPSFMLRGGDHHYHCFGCGAHGDAIQFLMQMLRISFSEAVETLAEKFRVPLVTAERKEERGIDKSLLRDATETASLFYHCYLLQSEEGREALHYLEGRGISLNFITRFEIGLAPSLPGLLKKVMASRKISEEVLLHAGLLGKENRNDFFRDRITFPIKNAMGSTIGFSARKYKEATFGGKYINTPETSLFKKSRTLFGLHQSRARIAKERRALIVEGQIDCLKLIESGFDFTVASLGTAFGAEHVQDLQNLGCLQATLLFDGDEAGVQASIKVGSLFQKVGIEVKVVTMPEKEDPDSILTKFGVKKLDELLHHSQDYLKFLVEYHSKKLDLKSPAQKAELIHTISTEIKGWEDKVMVHESLKALSRLTNVPENVVGIGPPPPMNFYKKVQLQKNEIDPNRVLELDLLRWLLLVGEENEKLVELVSKYLNQEHFWTLVCQKIFVSYMDAYQAKGPRDLLSILIHIEEEEGTAVMDEILKKKINHERAEKHIVETIQKILDRSWLKEKEKIKCLIDAEENKEEDISLLLKQLDALNARRPIVTLNSL